MRFIDFHVVEYSPDVKPYSLQVLDNEFDMMKGHLDREELIKDLLEPLWIRGVLHPYEVDCWYFVTQLMRKITEILSSLYLGRQSFPKPDTGPLHGRQLKSPMVGVHQMIWWLSNVLGWGLAAKWLS